MLVDLLVVDLSDGIAGGYTGKLLTDAGGTTVRVEAPEGTRLRRVAAAPVDVDPDEGSALFRFLDGGKRSVIDVGDNRSRLLSVADVIITDRDDGEELVRDHPSAIVVSHSPFGLTGPWSGRAATEFTVQAWAGSTGGRGPVEGTPVAAGGDLASWVAGVVGAAAVLVAWRGGAGTLIDVSELETAVAIYNGFQTVAGALTGEPSPTPPRVIETPSVEPAADGWVGFCALSAPQFRAFAEMVERPEWADDPDISRIDYRVRNSASLRSPIASWTGTRTVADIVAEAVTRRIPVAPVGNGETVTTIEQFVARDAFTNSADGSFVQPRPAARFSATKWRPVASAPRIGADDVDDVLRDRTSPPRPAPVHAWPLPLAGLRVFDLTSFWAGPVVTQLFAAFGADVIKIESVQRPDGTRMTTSYGVAGARPWERAPLFHGCNTGKRGVTLDLSRPRGRELAARLLERCDVLIENFTPRVAEGFGLLDGVRDDQIVVRMPAWGLDGPWRDQPGFAQTTEQVSGLAWVTGQPDGPPLAPRGPCDPNGGYHAFVATMLALLERDRTGRGQVVEATLVEAALNIAAQQVVEWSAYGHRIDRLGNRSAAIAPQGVYRAAGEEQWVALSVADEHMWAMLCTVTGRGDWATDAELGGVDGRRRRHDELDAGIADWLGTRDAGAAVDQLAAAGVAAAVVVAPREVGDNPQLHARGFFEEVAHPVAGVVPLPRMPAMLGGRPGPFHAGPAPTLGQHSREVLAELLGLDDHELDALEVDGIIGEEPR